MNAEQKFKKLGYMKIVAKDGVFFAYERPSDIDGYVERIYFDNVTQQFMAEEIYDDEYEDETTSKYISLEEFDAINTQIAELGWRSEKTKK